MKQIVGRIPVVKEVPRLNKSRRVNATLSRSRIVANEEDQPGNIWARTKTKLDPVPVVINMMILARTLRMITLAKALDLYGHVRVLNSK